MKQVSPGDAVARKYPEWIVMVVANDEQGRPNVMPAGWGMICSGQPLYVAVSIAYTRYTYKCIHATGEYVFAWAGKARRHWSRKRAAPTAARLTSSGSSQSHAPIR
jgi:flavin reductase (DIM6/NTAB) family NADH-FMN oxidoreductase RutF